MLGGALAGFLKVAAVVAVTAGMGGSVYLLTQVNDESDTANLQAPETSVTAETATAPSATPEGTAQATPTQEGPTPTSADTDTSNWETYESPLGFAIKYPSGWKLVTSNAQAQPSAGGEYALITNPTAQEDTSREAGALPGVIVVDIRPYPEPYDAALLREICEPSVGAGGPRDPFDGPADTATVVTIEGRPGLLCERHDITPAGLDTFSSILHLQLQDSQVASITSGAIGPSTEELELARAILDTLVVNEP
jgi:hypothetical protein